MVCLWVLQDIVQESKIFALSLDYHSSVLLFASVSISSTVSSLLDAFKHLLALLYV